MSLESETKFKPSYVIKSTNKIEDQLSGDSKRLNESMATTERLKPVSQHMLFICTIIAHVNSISITQFFTEKYSVNIINIILMNEYLMDFNNNASSDTH